MKKFMIFCLLGIAITNLCEARVYRDVSHGYKYHPGHSSSGSNFLQTPNIISTTSYAPTASGISYTQPSTGYVSSDFGGSFGSVGSSLNTGFGGFGSGSSSSSGFGSSGFGSFGSGGSNGFGSSGFGSIGSSGLSGFGVSSSSYNSGSPLHINYEKQHQNAFFNQAPIVTKHFYIHSAPEDHDEQQIVRYVNVGRPQQHYRVVFINAPTSSASKAKIIANVAPIEDKTAIYVLAKKSNALDVSAEVVTPAPISHKPEVFFVKYKTPAEAEHAQHVIQAQYDSLGGTSQVTNEGVVPVSSVIGSLGGETEVSDNVQHVDNVGVNVIQTGTGIDSTQIVSDALPQTYLPTHQKKKK